MMTRIHRSMTARFSFGLLMLITSTSSCFGGVQRVARMTADASNLRQIAQASFIYAQDHQGQLPEATDVWNYAEILARDAGLEDARMWRSKLDPGTEPNENVARILLPEKPNASRDLDPEFRRLVLSVSVPVGASLKNVPPTTPIAWTRGLQTDGTWAAHSPYGIEGGNIAFANGTVTHYKNLTTNGELISFDGKGQTSNILKALPPGSKISEYIPNPEEKMKWAEASRTTLFERHQGLFALLTYFMIFWAPFLSVSIYRIHRKKPGALQILIWPIFLTVLAAIIMPGCF